MVRVGNHLPLTPCTSTARNLSLLLLLLQVLVTSLVSDIVSLLYKPYTRLMLKFVHAQQFSPVSGASLSKSPPESCAVARTLHAGFCMLLRTRGTRVSIPTALDARFCWSKSDSSLENLDWSQSFPAAATCRMKTECSAPAA